MQRISSLLLSQIFVLLVVGSYSYAWSRDDSELKRMYSSYASQLKRPQYDFGLGKRSLEEPESYEDSYPALGDSPSFPDKKASPQSMYSFGLGKRNRAYGFGLGKRLENLWKYSSSGPANRQERRSKIYSFGLGKRAGQDMSADAEEFDEIKRANGGRQFSFGLGKRDVSSASHVNAS